MKLEQIIILQGLLSAVGMFVCYKEARELNRSKGGWGFFGLIIPIVAMIWIFNIKPLTDYNKDKLRMEKQNYE